MSGSQYGALSPALGPWAQNLQPASWRGVPFAVQSSVIKRGRKTAVHDYPYRDVIWVEDLGRGRRAISFRGFLVGDDVYAQRDAMLTAIETEGPGNLVHPSLGTLSVSLVDSSAGEDNEHGRVVTLEFSFLQGEDKPSYPTTDDSTQDDVNGAADDCDDAAQSDYVDGSSNALDEGETAVAGGVATMGGFAATVVGTAGAIALLAQQAISVTGAVIGTVLGTVGQAIGLVNDAAISAGVVLGLPGNYGRYAYGGLTTPLPPTATVASQIAALTVARASVTASVGSAIATAATNPAALPAAVQGAVADLLATIPNPADQIRLLAVLAAYNPPVAVSTAPIGAAVATMQTQVATLVRRAACAALGRAAAAYQPTSYNDAVAQIDTLTTVLDAEALVAADAGDEASYTALRSLRTAVATDLITRGAGLPQLVTVTRARSLPALVLAYQLYADATRADDLVARANPVNALFMPVEFQALAS